jgi:TPP-dependent pyruvate/acetoin dehydrogenase alpha subunit
MDVLAVEDAARRAVTAVRDGMEPLFLELQTYRFRAHSMYDPDLYRSKEEIERWKQHDPIPTLTARLQDECAVTDDELAALRESIDVEVADAVAFAEAGTLEPVEQLERFVTCEGSP